MTPSGSRLTGTESRALGLLAALRARVADNPTGLRRWLPLQVETFRDPAFARLMRAGNQTLGKTVTGAADLVAHVTGDNPWCPEKTRTDRPIRALVVFGNKDQSLAIQEKIFAAIPREALHPSTRYEPARGLISRKQTFRVRHRSGGWSIIRFVTSDQGARAIMGGTLDYVWLDEPPSWEVYQEATNRLRQAGKFGRLLMTLTPINADCRWIRALVEAGKLSDHWRPLSPAELIPVGLTAPIRTDDGTPKDQAWIDAELAKVEDYLVPVVIHGDWESRSVERYFSWFRNGGSTSHVHDRIPEGAVQVLLGIDHGAKPGRQIALLTYVQEEGPEPIVYVADEYVDRTGGASPKGDATGILAMLRRNETAWKELDWAMGDRVLMPGTAEQKSNHDLAREIERETGLQPGTLDPPIRTAKRGENRNQGSPAIGAKWLYWAIKQERFAIHPRCTRTIEALERYHMASDDEYKDPIDALRYALDRWIFPRYAVSAPNVVRFR